MRGKDYSFISNRGDRIEFRTACSQPSVRRLLDLINFRFRLIDAAISCPPAWIDDYDFTCSEFRKACIDGALSKEVEAYERRVSLDTVLGSKKNRG